MRQELYIAAAKAAIRIIAVASLAFLLNSCSTEQPEDQARKDRSHETRSEETRGTTEEARSGPQVSLVPIAHLTSAREDVSTQELSQSQELAVPREFRRVAAELLARSDFEGFDSAEAVVDHVSRTPEAVGLVPWETVSPRVKALAVDGGSLVQPGAAPESYP